MIPQRGCLLPISFLLALILGVSFYTQSEEISLEPPLLPSVIAVTITPLPIASDGFTLSGSVAEFPPCNGAMRGVTVQLEPLGLATQTDLEGGRFSFEDIPSGDYRLSVSPACTPFGCWPETPVTIAGSDLEVELCPSIAGAAPTLTAIPLQTRISCDRYPFYCVPLVGGASPDGVLRDLETPNTRALDMDSQGSPGVVRGITSDGAPFLGDPTAPVHFLAFQDFSCPHCWAYHESDLRRFIEDYVITGEATLEVRLIAVTHPVYGSNAGLAALCAGEQGALWEVQDELWQRIASPTASGEAAAIEDIYDLKYIEKMVNEMGLDADRLMDCVTSGRYGSILQDNLTLMYDLGVVGVPTVLYSTDAWDRADHWTRTEREYENLEQLIIFAEF